MKKNLCFILLTAFLAINCSRAGIKPVENTPPPPRKYPLALWYITPQRVRTDYSAGKKITIRGKGFEKETVVYIGDRHCVSLKYVSDSQLSCRIPELPVGKYAVTILNPDGKEAPIKNDPPIEYTDDEYPFGTWLDDGLIYLEYTELKK